MMKKVSFLFLLAMSFCMVYAQDNTAYAPEYAQGKNILKLNLTGLPTRNIGLYGERVLSKRVSAVIGVNKMLEGGVPLLKQFGVEKKELTNARLSSFSVTPELRFYLGKGYGRGFYVAPYYRFEQFKVSGISFTYNNSVDLAIGGNLTTQSGGLMLGSQWLLGSRKNFVIDWGILGLHYGVSSGKLSGKPERPLTTKEQDDLRKDMSEYANYDLKLTKINGEVSVTPNDATISLNNSPWSLFRMNISVGYRF